MNKTSSRVARDAEAAALDAAVRAALDAGDARGAVALLAGGLGAPVLRYCRRLVGDDTLAEDVRQSVFVTVAERLAHLPRRSSLRAWVFAVAHNRCLDVLKSARRFDTRFALPGELPEHLADASPSAADRLDARAVHRALARALAAMAPPVRTALRLRYEEELSYEEMARICGERAGTLQARIARTLPLLRRCVDPASSRE